MCADNHARWHPPGLSYISLLCGLLLDCTVERGGGLWARFGASARQAMDVLMPLLRGSIAAVQYAGIALG